VLSNVTGAVRYACTSYGYDGFGNRTLIVGPRFAFTAGAGSPPPPPASYTDAAVTTFDPVNRAIAVQADRTTDASQAPASCVASGGVFASGAYVCTTRVTYDGLDNVISSTDANGAVSWFVYDGLSRKTESLIPRTTATVRADGTPSTPGQPNTIVTC